MSDRFSPRKKTAVPAANLQGGPGDDVFFVTNSNDVVLEAADGGRDVVYASVDWSINSGAHIEVLSAASQGATTPLILGGNEFDQDIYGNAGANLLQGGGGSDYLVGLGGDDAYIVLGSNDRIVESAGGGRDVVYALASYVLQADAEVEVLSAGSQGSTMTIELVGNAFNQDIYGNAGSNLLEGGGGVDYLVGLGGDDSYIVNGNNDHVVEAAGQGRDVVYTRGDYVLDPNVFVEILSTANQAATTAIMLIGSTGDQEIYGNAGVNHIEGGGGTDWLGGLGGNDIYVVVGSGDHVLEAAGGGSRDIVYAKASYALDANQEVEVLSAASQSATTAMSLTGNNLANEIYGNAGANTLTGGGGADVLAGLDGDDVYVVDSDDIVIEEGGPGTGIVDVVYATASYAIGASQHVEILAAFDPGSQAALNLTGNAFTQEMRGNAGANVLTALGGSAAFFGGAGADTLVSNAIGNRYYFDTALGGGNIDVIPNLTGQIMLAGQAGGPFAALAWGQLSFGCFVTGSAALEADDYLIYNSATGALLYDADGNGAGAAVQFATLEAGLTGLNSGIFDVTGTAPNHAPAITSSATASIAENSAASTIVYQAIASDTDGDRVTYRLTGVDAALLNIDAATGAVRLNNPADFEAKRTYSFEVHASDSANGGASRSITLTITNLPDPTPTPVLSETGAANDTYQTAQVIDRNGLAIGDSPNLPDGALPSVIIQGSASDSIDRDFFSITLQAGELLLLDVDNSSGNLDTYLRFYSPTGVEIAANDDLGALDPGSAAHPVYGHNTDSYLRFRAPTSGTYYFSIEPFQSAQNPTSGTYELNVSVGPVATKAAMFEEDIQALISGSQWNHNALTYGFPTGASQYPAGIAETDEAGEFAPFTAFQQGATTALLQMIANVSGLTFALNPSPGQADLRYAMSNEADVAYAYLPTNGGPTSLGGSAWFNQADFNNPIKGNYAWMSILHETGHALGLKHGHEQPSVNAIHDTLEYTVMTYRSHLFSPVNDDGGYTNGEWSYPQTLMMLDIAALQRLYGANFTYNAGDSVYTVNAQTLEISINGVGQGAPGGPDSRLFLTLWDGGGIDTYDFSNLAGTVRIDLRPGEWTTLGQGWLANLGNGSLAAGNIANALLFEGDPRSLIENVIGTAQQDLIIANQAANHLAGGGFSDLFKWYSAADAGLGAAADVVTDWQSDSDRLDLSAIDAKSGTAEDDAFSFIGTGAFSQVEGQLRYQVEGDSIRLQGDIDGNGAADFEIVLNHASAIADFYMML